MTVQATDIAADYRGYLVAAHTRRMGNYRLVEGSSSLNKFAQKYG
jgi:hypothetical protein